MELPMYLYTETTSPCGTLTKAIVAPDKLISWAEEGRGDAIVRLCRKVCEKKIEAIDAWESDRILQLEDEWIEAGDEEDVYGREDEDEDEDVNEKRYHLACEAVVRKAEKQRARVRERMTEHKTAVEKLVQEAREFVAAYEPPPQEEEDNILAYLLGIGAVVTAGYVLFY
jgi:hypothetical protein